MRLAAFLFVTLGALAQTAIVPSSILCPSPQVMIAVPSAVLGASTVVKFSCAIVDASVTIDKTVTPWIIKAVQQPTPAAGVASVSAGAGVKVDGSQQSPRVQVDASVVAFLQGLNRWSAMNQFDKLQITASKTDPLCADPVNLGKLWIDSNDPQAVHFRVCGLVAASPAWIAIF